jgi:hypothetical protein
MPTVALTAKSVLALPARAGGARSDYWDQKVAGLVLRVTAKARTYSVWYRINGAARGLTLGPADEITLADAPLAPWRSGLKRVWGSTPSL